MGEMQAPASPICIIYAICYTMCMPNNLFSFDYLMHTVQSSNGVPDVPGSQPFSMAQ